MKRQKCHTKDCGSVSSFADLQPTQSSSQIAICYSDIIVGHLMRIDKNVCFWIYHPNSGLKPLSDFKSSCWGRSQKVTSFGLHLAQLTVSNHPERRSNGAGQRFQVRAPLFFLPRPSVQADPNAGRGCFNAQLPASYSSICYRNSLCDCDHRHSSRVARSTAGCRAGSAA